MASALSAAPEHLRGSASVYVLKQAGFVLARKGTNGFSCIVNRDHPLNQKPTCYDAEGSETMLSGDIKNYDASTGKVESFPPHVMFYAPNLTNEDIGSDGNFDPGLPSIAYQGPQGFMIVVLGNTPHPAAGH
jgi:hypothetical protein